MPKRGRLQDAGILNWGHHEVNIVESKSSPVTCVPTMAPTASRIAFNVGGISFGVRSVSGVRLALDPSMTGFAFAAQNCDVEIEAEWVDSLELPSTSPSFYSGGLWKAYQDDAGLSFYFQTGHLGPAPYKKAEFDQAFSLGKVSLFRRYFDPELPVYPLEYPLDELLMIHRLAMGTGVEVHGCGVLTADGLGRLFVGHSGAGKSTTSRLWLSHPGARVLSDDRIILRREQGQLRMYGTPWHGDAGLAMQASGRVDRIFLLEQGSENEIVPLEKSQGVAELFARTFVPHYSAAGLTHALQFMEETVRAVPVSLFRFLPNSTAVEAILRAA